MKKFNLALSLSEVFITYIYILINFKCQQLEPGRVAQSVTRLATDACLTTDPGVASSIPVRSHTFESMCTNYWLTACSSLPRKKCG